MSECVFLCVCVCGLLRAAAANTLNTLKRFQNAKFGLTIAQYYSEAFVFEITIITIMAIASIVTCPNTNLQHNSIIMLCDLCMCTEYTRHLCFCVSVCVDVALQL